MTMNPAITIPARAELVDEIALDWPQRGTLNAGESEGPG